MRRLCIWVAGILGIVCVALMAETKPPDLHVWGHIAIPSKGITAEVYTAAHPQDCGCAPSLWHGGRVTVNADLSDVQVGDMADMRGLSGEHYVLECISVTGIPAWLQETQGDVLVIDERWVYRFTRL